MKETLAKSTYIMPMEEKKLDTSTKPYFFGTEKPSYIDAVLFAHLAEAVCDLHLVLLLAKHT